MRPQIADRAMIDQPCFVDEKKLTVITGISRRTWQHFRLHSKGPQFYRICGSLNLSDAVGNVATVRTLDNHVEALYGFTQAGKPHYVVRHRFWPAQHLAQDVARRILQELSGS